MTTRYKFTAPARWPLESPEGARSKMALYLARAVPDLHPICPALLPRCYDPATRVLDLGTPNMAAVTGRRSHRALKDMRWALTETPILERTGRVHWRLTEETQEDLQAWNDCPDTLPSLPGAPLLVPVGVESRLLHNALGVQRSETTPFLRLDPMDRQNATGLHYRDDLLLFVLSLQLPSPMFSHLLGSVMEDHWDLDQGRAVLTRAEVQALTGYTVEASIDAALNQINEQGIFSTRRRKGQVTFTLELIGAAALKRFLAGRAINPWI